MSTEGTARRRILVIDDDEVMRELLSALLTVQGFDVRVAASGNEALTLLAEPHPPALLLTDLQMPGLEGEALTSALRQAAPPSAVLIGMSGRQPNAAVLRPLDGFLAKPFDSKTLKQAFAAAQEAKATQPLAALAAAAVHTPPFAPSQAGSSPTGEVTSPASDATSDHHPVLDETIFSALARNFQPPQLLELYRLTLDDVRQRYIRMEAHAAVGDLDAVQREAHAIKGACGMVGARELAHLAMVVEKQTTLDPSVLATFTAAVERLQRALDATLPQKW